MQFDSFFYDANEDVRSINNNINNNNNNNNNDNNNNNNNGNIIAFGSFFYLMVSKNYMVGGAVYKIFAGTAKA